jgi:hypothetical protein
MKGSGYRARSKAAGSDHRTGEIFPAHLHNVLAGAIPIFDLLANLKYYAPPHGTVFLPLASPSCGFTVNWGCDEAIAGAGVAEFLRG